MEQHDTLQFILARKELAKLRAKYDRLKKIPVGMFRHTGSGPEAIQVVFEELCSVYHKIERLEKGDRE
jgi:hypothetical protein